MAPLNLPEKLDLDGSFEEIFAALYTVFKADFIDKRAFYQGLPIVFDNRKVDSEYEEGFWHLVTQGKDERIPDFKRAKRIPWIRPIIESQPHDDIRFWMEWDNDKRGRRVQKYYFWYENGSYIVVLKKIPRKYFLTTAFYVTGRRNYIYYKRKHECAQKKGPGG